MDAAKQPGVGRGEYAKSPARRKELVDVATQVFARDGYRGATMLQIATACGISRTGLLHHFPTKEKLLEAVLKARDRADSDRLSWADLDATTAFLKLVDLVRHNATVPKLITLYAVLSAEAVDPTHPAHNYFVARYLVSCRGLQSVFERARVEGILVPDADPRALAIDLVALMDGLQVQWLLDPDRVDMPAIVRDRIEAALTVALPRERPHAS